ncbi:hypothetical protein ACGFNU_32585 [Spirillospora sp. NPDC048911]|uniref:hypothetical protein n=1 Tax=Spirillospora sp. NPDC048911 TaxID=3364527 RepID=UPI00371F23B9
MRLNGRYLRITAAKLAKAVNDPAWAQKYVDEMLEDAPSRASPMRARPPTSEPLRQFFRAAACEREAMLTWVS